MDRKIAAYFFLLFAVWASAAYGAGEEEMARAAEQKGKLREALPHYVSALGSASEGGADDQRLREKIIGIAQKLDPLPAIPEEAKRHMGRGKAAFKVAENPEDSKTAADEFKKASDLAPWWGDAYFNLGLAYEQAKMYREAVFNLKLYLLAAPGSPDAEKVKEKLYELEFLTEREGAKQREEGEKKAKINALLGTWNAEVFIPAVGNGSVTSRSWGTVTFTMKDDVIEGHQTMTSLQISNWAPQYTQNPRPGFLLRGTLSGPDLEDIRWEVWRETNPLCPQFGGFKEVGLSISADLRRISFGLPSAYNSETGMCLEYISDYALTRG